VAKRKASIARRSAKRRASIARRSAKRRASIAKKAAKRRSKVSSKRRSKKLSAYNKFIQETIPKLSHLEPKDRMRVAARMYREKLD
jgi:hypothetical protein